ncbi:non-specific lipid transfer protein GPI-anchored 31-like [Andrographis paniculata]|uniref:non-specific lipid transfer protein GPI-anchored 31-like n=1 Tax=Andrographis paniculata TaxID=175694 RepID=UPI0021E9283D|nr:non-specific lipid transfer protein GPI-anchored 31-like [Andrographis paniculata]
MLSRSRPPLLPSIFALLVAVAASATPSAPPISGDCNGLIVNLAECLPYVMIGGTATKPEAKCCSNLKTVIDTNAKCLCEGFRNSAQLGVKINVTKALSLPAACDLKSPPIGDCGLSNAPGGSPGLPPSPTSHHGDSPAAAPAPGHEGHSESPPRATSMELLLKGSVMAGAAMSFVLF